MPRTHRIAPDCNDAGGCTTSTPQGTVYANNFLVDVDGAIGTSHAPCPAPSPPHCAGNWSTANGGPTVFAENIPINSAGDPDTCGHVRVAGSPNVFTDGGGGGAVYDNSEPLEGSPIVTLGDGRQNTISEQTSYVMENNDVEEEINPPYSGAGAGEQKDVVEQEVDQDPPDPVIPPTVDCSFISGLPSNFNWSTYEDPIGTIKWTSFTQFATDVSLSPNFTVKNLTLDPLANDKRKETLDPFRYSFTSNVTQRAGKTQKEILLNLCFLAQTVLEPMLSQYPNFRITSGFRNLSGGSQHNIGQAADFQNFSFHGTGSTSQQYYDAARQIKDTIDFDQIILEWFGGNPWIHLSSNSSGNRKKVTTQVSQSSYVGGLRRLG